MTERRVIAFGPRTGARLADIAQHSPHLRTENNGRSIDTNRMVIVRVTDITNTPADGIIQQVSDPDTGKLEDVPDGDCKVVGMAGITLVPNAIVLCRYSSQWIDPDDDDNQLPLEIAGSGGGDESLWATITERAKDVRGNWCYAWQEDLPKKFGQWGPGPRSGTTGAWVECVLFAPTDGSTVGEVWTITVHLATSGTFRLSVDGSQTSDIAYNASGSAISAALVAAGASLISGTYQFTDFDEHTIAWTKDDLKPKGSNLCYDVNNLKINPFHRERIWHGYHAHPKLKITKTVTGDGTNYTVYTVTIEDAGSGTYTLNWNGSGNTGPIAWDADATTVANAINTVAGSGTVTVDTWSKDSDDKITYKIHATTHPAGPDYIDYTLTGDGKNLIGADDWRVRWVKGADTSPPDSNGACVDVLTDVAFDPDTCTQTKTYTTVRVLGVFTDLDACNGGS